MALGLSEGVGVIDTLHRRRQAVAAGTLSADRSAIFLVFWRQPTAIQPNAQRSL
jgi:hypothetical protein